MILVYNWEKLIRIKPWINILLRLIRFLCKGLVELLPIAPQDLWAIWIMDLYLMISSGFIGLVSCLIDVNTIWIEWLETKELFKRRTFFLIFCIISEEKSTTSISLTYLSNAVKSAKKLLWKELGSLKYFQI